MEEELLDNCIKNQFKDCNDPNCAEASKHRHCLNCPKVLRKPYDCKRHFWCSHLKRAVKYKNKIYLPCKLNHRKHGKIQVSRVIAHFHCPICQKTVLKSERFIKHILNHEIHPEKHLQANKSRMAPPVQDIKIVDFKDVYVEKNTVIESSSKTLDFTSLRDCPICDKTMHKNSVPRHCREVHSKEISATSTCVDEERGLYLVRKSSRKSGVGYQIHVRKVLDNKSEHFGVDCEDKKCKRYMDECWKNGFWGVECHHLQEAGKFPEFPERVDLKIDLLHEFITVDNNALMDDTDVVKCKDLQDSAFHRNAHFVVAIVNGNRHIHFSVFDENVKSKFGRILVTADFSTGILDCQCCRRKRRCVHKIVCLWYLKQNNLLNDFINVTHTADGSISLDQVECEMEIENLSEEYEDPY